MIKRVEEKGVTLIALVVTIIILLILAGITIQMVLGQNGLITKSKLAAGKTRVSQIEEQIALAEFDVLDFDTVMVDGEKLAEKIKSIDGVNTSEYKREEGVVEVTYEDENGNKGGLTKRIQVGGKKILASEEEFEEKVEETLETKLEEGTYDILYDAYGNIIENPIVDKENNLTLWMYEYRTSAEGYQLNTDERYNESVKQPAYNGSIVNGTIVGEIPAYIVSVENGQIAKQSKVTSYKGIFANIKDLKKWPDNLVVSPIIERLEYVFDGTEITEIPKPFMTFSKEVFSIEGLFTNTEITNIPAGFRIGENVENMNHLFENSKIVKVPDDFVIPDSVENCEDAFRGCTELKEVGNGFKIGSGVKMMSHLFSHCDKLEKINLTIPSQVTDIHRLLENDYVINDQSSVTIVGNAFESALYNYSNMFDHVSQNFEPDDPNKMGLKVYYHGNSSTVMDVIISSVWQAKVEFIDLDKQSGT